MKNLTYKKKNRLLLIGSVLLLLFVYRFAIRTTMNAWARYADAQEQLLLAADAPAKVIELEKSLQMMDAKTGERNKTVEAPGELLETITGYCQEKKAVLREFPQTVISETDDLLIETNHFVVQGNFKTLLDLVYLLEQQKPKGKLASVRYLMKKDPKTRTMTLTAGIYLQQVKKIDVKK